MIVHRDKGTGKVEIYNGSSMTINTPGMYKINGGDYIIYSDNECYAEIFVKNI